MIGRSSIQGNEAREVGGGIYNAHGTAQLGESANVVGNTAVQGGGYASDSGTPEGMFEHVAVSPNAPDDAPDVAVTDC
jgi:hypothetical protein